MRTFDDFTLPGFWQDPFPAFQRSFEAGARLQASPDGGVAVLGHQALYELGRHPAVDGTPMSAPPAREPSGIFELLRHAVFTQVGPQHRQLRRAALAGLNFAAVDAFDAHAEALAARRLEAFAGRSFDLVTDFMTPFVAEAWCAFMGYAPEDAAAIAAEVEQLTAQLGFTPDPARAAEADAAAHALVRRTEALLARGGEGPAQRMASAVPDDRAVAAGLVASLLFDAVDTVGAGLSGVVAVLLGAEPRGRLDDAAVREAAIEEALRLATPTVLTVRQAREALAFDGMQIPQGALIWMWWAAGNVDPFAFEAPAHFRPGRPRRAMPFGVGAHACLGHVWVKMLAHAVVRLALAGERRLAAEAPGITWVSGGARRPKDLRVTFR